jgi:hypothetical protein
MKRLITETNETALESLMGKKVTFFCVNYFYVGELVGVNEASVCIKNPAIVYETGKFTDKKYKNEESLNIDEWYIQTSSIESFGVLK